MSKASKIRNAMTLSLALGALLAGGTAMAADNKSPPKESNQPVSDTWITTKVKSDLLATDNVSGTDVSVETKNGVVWLSGSVKTQAEHDKAVSVAKGIEGVKKVDASKLKVAAGTAKN